jgi:hypothetical protein
MKLVGNVLGGVRAEADTEMLSRAFVETADFRALSDTKDFNIVVGRRGTGKSALFLKLAEHFERQKQIILFTVHPAEHEALGFQASLEHCASNYMMARATARVIWRAHLLYDLADILHSHWKLKSTREGAFLASYRREHDALFSMSGANRCAHMVDYCGGYDRSESEIPGLIASVLGLERLQDAVRDALQARNSAAVFLFDGLDEGWRPSNSATAILGGLAVAVSDFRDASSEIHGVLFVRDNILRALATLDDDFSRHIEGSSLRLHWDERGLLHLICERLRVVLGLINVESDNKVWNRVAQRELKGIEGFRECLRHTLYRPRDIMVLLNRAFSLAARSGRDALVGADIEATSKQVSQDRLSDLLKEYRTVFPGLELFVKSFEGRVPIAPFHEIVALLDAAAQESDFSRREQSDFAVLGSGSQVFYALYSVGFLGFEDSATGSLIFCHDGTNADLSAASSDQRVVVHPCYWNALNIGEGAVPPDVLVEIHDDYEMRENPATREMRMRRLGELVAALPNMPTGTDGCRDFEDWVLRTVRILFSGVLSNPELRPNGPAVQQRDVVATNMASGGFWKRVLDDYGSRQIVFEVKNYADLRQDDIKQAVCYSGKDYGRFVVIVHRGEAEGLDQTRRAWVREYWTHKNTVVFLLPASMLARGAAKLRNPERADYMDRALNKRLDTFTRKYLPVKHG